MNTISKSLALAVAVLLSFGSRAQSQEEDVLDPLGEVIVDMQMAGGRLSKLLTDKPTQQKQKDAVDKLDALIKLLEEQRRQGQSGANPIRPADKSTIMSGPGGSGPLHAANRNGKGWGQLPAHKRQQILQSMTEGFPAHYQQILERYYRRLAEEKPAGEESSDVPSPGDPSAAASRQSTDKRPRKRNLHEALERHLDRVGRLGLAPAAALADDPVPAAVAEADKPKSITPSITSPWPKANR